MRSTLILLSVVILLQACSHPIDIVGEGDVLSATGDRDCLLEESQAGLDNCSKNYVINDYQETYFAVPRSGSQFHRWANYCVGSNSNECSFDIPADAVHKSWGATVPPLTAIFRPTVNTGLNALLIGHSFFNPYAQALPSHAQRAGFVDHTQTKFFSGGSTGAPLALWNNASQRTAIQAVLNTGNVELFGMTYHPDYPTIEGYRNWVTYALQKNPDTRFFIAMPWATLPASFDAATYEGLWHVYHAPIAHGFIDTLRREFPGVDFYCVPYGQSAVELRNLYSAGALPDVSTLVSSSVPAIYRDTLGHPDDILIALGELVWLRAIYGVDLSTYNYNPGYSVDLKAIAQAITDEHDPNYNAP